jgi:hypothetical protein
MKANSDSAALAMQISQAVATPLGQTEPTPPKPVKKAKAPSVKLILAIPPDLHKHYDKIAIQRTKATGRGVTVQQVILELMERNR